MAGTSSVVLMTTIYMVPASSPRRWMTVSPIFLIVSKLAKDNSSTFSTCIKDVIPIPLYSEGSNSEKEYQIFATAAAETAATRSGVKD